MTILLLIIIFIIAIIIVAKKTGIQILSGFKEANNRSNPIRFRVISILISLVFAILLVVAIMREFVVSDFNKFKHMNEDNYNYVEIFCYSNYTSYPFPSYDLKITDKNRIKKYHNVLSERHIFIGNHPQTIWKVKLVFVDNDWRTHVFEIAKTNNSGTLITYSGIAEKNHKYSLRFRNDDVENLLIEDMKTYSANN
jgi:hypothetical protein